MDFWVYCCEREEIEDFVNKHHYSHSINGVRTKYCFKLVNMKTKEIVGAIIYAGLGMANVWKKYGEKEADVVELRRLCCIDDTPSNMESWFIAKTLAWLKLNSEVKVVISYADSLYNHVGTVYKASNFTYLGTTSPSRMIEWNGKIWH